MTSRTQASTRLSPGIEVARRLVEHAPAVVHLLDEQKAAVRLDDSGHRHRRRRHSTHAALRVFARMKSAMRATPCSIAACDAA